MIPLGIYTRYSASGASSRLRYLRYAETLKKSGFDVHVHTLLPDRYLERLYSGRSGRLIAAGAVLKRMRPLPRTESNLWIEYELLPYLPLTLEKILIGGRKFVLDFDDAVYLKYRNDPFLDGKYERLASRAAGVIAANDVLLEHFSRVNPNTVKIPTAVAPAAYSPTEHKHTRFTAVWIGTPVTFHAHLEPFLPTLAGIRRELDLELVAIGAPSGAFDGAPWARALPWSEEAERTELPRCHVGIMPLPEHDGFAAGKSAYKLLQYLAAGIPVIASPIGENQVVVKPGTNGFTASTAGEWKAALCALAADDALRDRMAENARRDAENYSVARIAPMIADFLKKSFFLS